MLAFIIEAFANEKLKRDALEKELRWARGDFSNSYGGVVDWRSLLVRSNVDFSGFLLARNRHHSDVYDVSVQHATQPKQNAPRPHPKPQTPPGPLEHKQAIYKDEVLRAFPVLSSVQQARSLYPVKI
jgi:hypothetical protein